MRGVIMRGVMQTMTSVLLMEGAEMGVAETTPMVAIVEGLKTMVAMVEGGEMGVKTMVAMVESSKVISTIQVQIR